MARRDPQASQKAFDVIEGLFVPVINDMDDRMLAHIKRSLKQMSDENNVLSNTAKTRALRLQLVRAMDEETIKFLDDTVGNQVWRDAIARGETPTPQVGQDKVLADSAVAVSDLSRAFYKTLGMDVQVMLADRLQDASESLTTHYKKQSANANRIISLGLSGEATESQMLDQLKEAGFLGGNVKGTPAHARTVLQSVVMENFRVHQTEIAKEIDTDLFQMVGPPPMTGDKGHAFCQAHYMEVHTAAEWEELAGPFAGDTGLNPGTILVQGNGFGCRHAYSAVAKSDRVDAIKDGAETRRRYDNFVEAQEALNVAA